MAEDQAPTEFLDPLYDPPLSSRILIVSPLAFPYARVVLPLEGGEPLRNLADVRSYLERHHRPFLETYIGASFRSFRFQKSLSGPATTPSVPKKKGRRRRKQKLVFTTPPAVVRLEDEPKVTGAVLRRRQSKALRHHVVRDLRVPRRRAWNFRHRRSYWKRPDPAAQKALSAREEALKQRALDDAKKDPASKRWLSLWIIRVDDAEGSSGDKKMVSVGDESFSQIYRDVQAWGDYLGSGAPMAEKGGLSRITPQMCKMQDAVSGRTLLHYACMNPFDVGVVKDILGLFGTPDAKKSLVCMREAGQGYTPLHDLFVHGYPALMRMIRKGSLSQDLDFDEDEARERVCEIVGLLSAAGADVKDSRDKQGRTVACTAFETGSFWSIECLVSAGADLSVSPSPVRPSPRMLYLLQDSDVPLSEEFVRLFKDKSLVWSSQLVRAMFANDDIDGIRKLVTWGVLAHADELLQKDEYVGRNGIHRACESTSTQCRVLRFLLATPVRPRGKKVTPKKIVPDVWGETPLHVAVRSGNAAAAKILMQKLPGLANRVTRQKRAPIHVWGVRAASSTKSLAWISNDDVVGLFSDLLAKTTNKARLWGQDLSGSTLLDRLVLAYGAPVAARVKQQPLEDVLSALSALKDSDNGLFLQNVHSAILVCLKRNLSKDLTKRLVAMLEGSTIPPEVLSQWVRVCLANEKFSIESAAEEDSLLNSVVFPRVLGSQPSVVFGPHTILLDVVRLQWKNASALILGHKELKARLFDALCGADYLSWTREHFWRPLLDSYMTLEKFTKAAKESPMFLFPRMLARRAEKGPGRIEIPESVYLEALRGSRRDLAAYFTTRKALQDDVEDGILKSVSVDLIKFLFTQTLNLMDVSVRILVEKLIPIVDVAPDSDVKKALDLWLATKGFYDTMPKFRHIPLVHILTGFIASEIGCRPLVSISPHAPVVRTKMPTKRGGKTGRRPGRTRPRRVRRTPGIRRGWRPMKTLTRVSVMHNLVESLLRHHLWVPAAALVDYLAATGDRGLAQRRFYGSGPVNGDVLFTWFAICLRPYRTPDVPGGIECATRMVKYLQPDYIWLQTARLFVEAKFDAGLKHLTPLQPQMVFDSCCKLDILPSAVVGLLKTYSDLKYLDQACRQSKQVVFPALFRQWATTDPKAGMLDTVVLRWVERLPRSWVLQADTRSMIDSIVKSILAYFSRHTGERLSVKLVKALLWLRVEKPMWDLLEHMPDSASDGILKGVLANLPIMKDEALALAMCRLYPLPKASLDQFIPIIREAAVLRKHRLACALLEKLPSGKIAAVLPLFRVARRSLPFELALLDYAGKGSCSDAAHYVSLSDRGDVAFDSVAVADVVRTGGSVFDSLLRLGSRGLLRLDGSVLSASSLREDDWIDAFYGLFEKQEVVVHLIRTMKPDKSVIALLLKAAASCNCDDVMKYLSSTDYPLVDLVRDTDKHGWNAYHYGLAFGHVEFVAHWFDPLFEAPDIEGFRRSFSVDSGACVFPGLFRIIMKFNDRIAAHPDQVDPEWRSALAEFRTRLSPAKPFYTGAVGRQMEFLHGLCCCFRNAFAVADFIKRFPKVYLSDAEKSALVGQSALAGQSVLFRSLESSKKLRLDELARLLHAGDEDGALALLKEDSARLSEAMADSGQSLVDRDASDKTLLHIACFKGMNRLARFLIEKMDRDAVQRKDGSVLLRFPPASLMGSGRQYGLHDEATGLSAADYLAMFHLNCFPHDSQYYKKEKEADAPDGVPPAHHTDVVETFKQFCDKLGTECPLSPLAISILKGSPYGRPVLPHLGMPLEKVPGVGPLRVTLAQGPASLRNLTFYKTQVSELTLNGLLVRAEITRGGNVSWSQSQTYFNATLIAREPKKRWKVVKKITSDRDVLELPQDCVVYIS